jgi:GH43 family beta-xylosidase
MFKNFLILTLFFFYGFFGVVLSANATNVCPLGSINGYSNGTCWMINTNPMNFIEAERFCQQNGGHLTSIHDAFNNLYLADQARQIFSQADDYYLGGSDLQSHKQWAWTDSSNFDFTDWANYEPVDSNINNCLVVSVLTGFWHSHDCTLKAPFICTLNPIPLSNTFTNPILHYGPDPWVLKHGDYYYYTHTMQSSIVIYKTKTMSQLKSVKPVTVWTPPNSGDYSKEVWAPEIHFIDNKFYIYFAADNGTNDFHRIYCLENPSNDPTTGNWTFKGKVADTSNDHWAIDVDSFEYQGQRYMLWSGWEHDENHAQNIYIAKMQNPWTLNGSRVMISTPDYDWETIGAPPTVNEGPVGLISPQGKLFVTYSASGCWTDNYALGLLSLKDGGDPMNAGDWMKSNISVFSQNPSGGAFGTGHNGFFKSPDGTEDWIIYHANPKAGQACETFRSPRMQKFTWNSDGSPNFGPAVAINTPLPKPSGE